MTNVKIPRTSMLAQNSSAESSWKCFRIFFLYQEIVNKAARVNKNFLKIIATRRNKVNNIDTNKQKHGDANKPSVENKINQRHSQIEWVSYQCEPPPKKLLEIS